MTEEQRNDFSAEVELNRNDPFGPDRVGKAIIAADTRMKALEKRVAAFEHLFPATAQSMTTADAETIIESHYVHRTWKVKAEASGGRGHQTQGAVRVVIRPDRQG